MKRPNDFNGLTTELATWEGDLDELARAMAKVTNRKTVGKLVMPMLFRCLFLGYPHDMSRFLEAGGAIDSPGFDIDSCKRLIPEAFTAEDWFRFQLGNRGLS
jgi:hypothetical protein